MDNIVFKKIWNDSGEIGSNSNFLFEVKLTCTNKNIMVSENYYMWNDRAKEIAEAIRKVIKKQKEQIVDFTEKKDSTITGYSLKILPPDVHGHILIFVEMGIGNDCKKEHYSKFIVETELGLLEQFGNKIEKMAELNLDEEIALN